MKPMREKIQVKINSMASILLDDIIVPGEHEQEGNETIDASFYDKDGNRFTFTLSLAVVPKVKDEDPEEETPATISDQITTILEKVSAIEEDVAKLKTYHPSPDGSTENESEPDPTVTPNDSTVTEDPNNEGSDINGDKSG